MEQQIEKHYVPRNAESVTPQSVQTQSVAPAPCLDGTVLINTLCVACRGLVQNLETLPTWDSRHEITKPLHLTLGDIQKSAQTCHFCFITQASLKYYDSSYKRSVIHTDQMYFWYGRGGTSLCVGAFLDGPQDSASALTLLHVLTLNSYSCKSSSLFAASFTKY